MKGEMAALLEELKVGGWVGGWFEWLLGGFGRVGLCGWVGGVVG